MTNTYAGPTTQISVDKTWHDDDNRDGVRPGQITYELWEKVGANGTEEKVDEVSVPLQDDGSAPLLPY